MKSASPPKADLCGAVRDVGYGPKADKTKFNDWFMIAQI
jgi:hypothetical protein